VLADSSRGRSEVEASLAGDICPTFAFTTASASSSRAAISNRLTPCADVELPFRLPSLLCAGMPVKSMCFVASSSWGLTAPRWARCVDRLFHKRVDTYTIRQSVSSASATDAMKYHQTHIQDARRPVLTVSPREVKTWAYRWNSGVSARVEHLICTL
jgi:hypothetical protein